MLKSLETLKRLKDRNMINDQEEIKLRANIQRNNLSADLTISLISRLSDRISELENKLINAKEAEPEAKNKKAIKQTVFPDSSSLK
jgi:hypothetical protein